MRKTVTRGSSRWRSGCFRWTDDSLDRERRITAVCCARNLALCQSRGEQPVLVTISLPPLSPRVVGWCYFRDRFVIEMFIKYVDVFMDEGYASDSSNVRILLILAGLKNKYS